MVNYFPAGKRIEISNLVGWFRVKDELIETKTFTGDWFCDTEGQRKVWTKTKSMFPNQPKQIGEFLCSRGEGSTFKIYTTYYIILLLWYLLLGTEFSRMRKNADQNNSEYRHFSRSENYAWGLGIVQNICKYCWFFL